MEKAEFFSKVASSQIILDKLSDCADDVIFFNDLKEFYKNKPEQWISNAYDLKSAQLLLDPDKASFKHIQDKHAALKILDKIKEYDLYDVWHLESELCFITAGMERSGVRVDVNKLSTMKTDLLKKIEDLEKDIFDCAGSRLNLNSPKQIEDLLFSQLKLPTAGVKRTKTGFSTDSDTLMYLSQFHPIPEMLIKHRTLSKLLSGFVNPLLSQAGKNNVIFPTIRQIGAATGRIIYEKPNLQNLPIKDELGKAVRNCIVPEPNCVFVRADYSQIELRVLAHMTDDPYLIDAFAKGKDIHAETARLIFNLENDAPVLPQQRAIGKTVNFSILYGMGHWGLAKALSITPEAAKGILDSFFSKLTRVDLYFKRMKEESARTGYLKSLLGRIRWIDKLRGVERDRLIKNTPIQSTAADIIKKAMVDITKQLFSENMSAVRIKLQVHDELVISAPQNLADQVAALVKDRMENTIELKVPLKVETKIGNSWGEVS